MKVTNLNIRFLPLLLPVAIAGAVLSDRANAETSTFTPLQDTTIFQDFPDHSNGAGSVFIAGRAGGNSSPAPLRRALLAFDLAALPQGTQVQSVSLTLTLTQSSSASLVPLGLYRVTSAWGEAGSVAASPGQGVAAASGDTTWSTRDFGGVPAVPWTVPGGDYLLPVSASSFVGGLTGAAPTPYTWASTPQLVADVQHWLDDPASNFGWLVIGSEGSAGTARQFASRENLVERYRPTLTLIAAPVPEPSSWLMFIAGFGLLMPFARWRARATTSGVSENATQGLILEACCDMRQKDYQPYQSRADRRCQHSAGSDVFGLAGQRVKGRRSEIG